jgi:hypothetical protein
MAATPMNGPMARMDVDQGEQKPEAGLHRQRGPDQGAFGELGDTGGKRGRIGNHRNAPQEAERHQPQGARPEQKADRQGARAVSMQRSGAAGVPRARRSHGGGGWFWTSSPLDPYMLGVMVSFRPRRLSLAVRRALAAASLLSMLVRAMLPAGFMPDLEALADGRFAPVVCRAAIAGERPGPPESSDDGGAAPPCPFAAVAELAPALPGAPWLAVPPLMPVAIAVDRQWNGSIRPVSPLPVGSRAPPLLPV